MAHHARYNSTQSARLAGMVHAVVGISAGTRVAVGESMNKLDLMSIAAECRRIVLAAKADLPDLRPAQYLDLVADNIEDVPLETLRAALVVAGVGY